jgi:hypothetical protein
MARRGRPKKEPFIRDIGTPELQAKRQESVGEGNDPQLSTSVLDMHLAKKLITLEEHTVCQNYQFYHRSIYGKPFITSSLGAIGTVKSKVADKETKFDLFITQQLNKMENFISQNYGLGSIGTFRQICIYDKAPYYLLQKNAKEIPMYKNLKKFLKKFTRHMVKEKKN